MLRGATTEFPELTIVPDPLTEGDHARANRVDPSLAEDVIPSPVPPESASPAFVAPPTGTLQQPEEQPQAARYHESMFRWTSFAIHDANSRGSAIWLELARWTVPNGMFGIISHIDTHFGLSIPMLEDDGRSVPNEFSFDHPDKAFLIDSLYALKWGDYAWSGGWEYARSGICWLLRLESTGRIEEGHPLGVTAYNSVPGVPFPPLAGWDDLRFAWGRSREPLRLLVPEGHTVRLYVGPRIFPGMAEQNLVLTPAMILGTRTFANILGALGYVFSELAINLDPDYEEANCANVAGRIVGTLQSYDKNPEAYRLARRGLT